MIVCAAGDCHGAIDRLYQDLLAFQESLRVRFSRVLHVGDVGIWPDPARIDGATKRHDGAGDFPRWWAERRAAPIETLFVKGNHEDFVWLDERTDSEILPGLFYVRNGTRFDIRDDAATYSVGVMGGCFGPSDYHRRSRDLRSYGKRHYTRDEIDALIAGGPVDVLLVHDAPAGVTFERHRRGAGWTSDTEGLDDLIRRVHPRICFFGHHHARIDAEIHGVRCIGLNKVRCPGNLVAVELGKHRKDVVILGEWPVRNPSDH